MKKKGKKKRSSGITFEGDVTINGPMFDIHDNQKVYLTNPQHEEDDEEENEDLDEEDSDDDELPTRDMMAAACEKSYKEGLWWSDTAWSVVFRIYCIKGYKGTVKSFVDDVPFWPFQHPFAMHCNRHSVSRPLQRGRITGPLSKWAANGALAREIKLGERLMALIKDSK